MAILSKRIMQDVSRLYQRAYGRKPYFMDLSGTVINVPDPLAGVSHARRKRDYALQESVNLGTPYAFSVGPGLAACIVSLEDRRMVHGGVIGCEVVVQEESDAGDPIAFLVSQGMSAGLADAYVAGIPTWPRARVAEAGEFLKETFYLVSGWSPDLMKENRLRALQKEQINQAIEDQRKRGKQVLYAFEKERMLLANIRAGDRNEARRILNEMLGAIYMSSPQLVVLRARAVELMTCLTRAAIEDNPLMEPLIERNHAWTERLVQAGDFEGLSGELMSALDDFIDGIYLHGANRSNTKVRQALDHIGRDFMKRISLSSVAAEVGLSPCRLAHLVKECTGRTVLQIIQQVRIRHAQHLLERTSKSCTEIAYDVGFGDQSYFTKHFKRLTGTTPMRYRRFGAG